MSLEAKAEAFLARVRAAPQIRAARRRDAQALAEALKQAGVTLCHSRATEHSPRVGVLFLAAAKVAAIGYDDDERPAHFERDLGDGALRAEYDRFVASL